MVFKGNGRDINTTRKAYIKGHDEVWFDEQSITNIFSLKKVKRKLRVTHDSRNYRFFSVHNPISQGVYFNIHKDGLYYHNTKNCHTTLVQTVSENEAG